MEIFTEKREEIDETLLKTMEKAAIYLVERDSLDEERCQISLTLVNKEEIRRLNKEYRGIDRETDVLSFPQYDSLEDIQEEGEIPLGDVVICMEIAETQAEEYGHSLKREIIYLFVHSVCHLLGFDHMAEDEKKAMRKREEETMDYLNIPRV